MKKHFLTTVRYALCALVLCAFSVEAAYSQSDLQKAQTLFKQKEYPSALPLAQAAVKAAPKDVTALLLLGDVFDALDQSDSAMVYFNKAQDQDYYKTDVMKRVALGLSALEKHPEAVKKAQEIIKNYPKDPTSYLTFSQVLVAGNEKIKETVEDYKPSNKNKKDPLIDAEAQIIKAQQIDPNLTEAFVARGDLNFAQRIYELAQDNYEKALKRDSTLLKATVNLATTYFRRGNEQGATKEDNLKYVNLSVQTWDKATRLDTNNVKAFYEKGRILYLAKQFKPSAVALTRYITLKPDGHQGRWYLAQSLFNVLKIEKTLDTALIQHLDIVGRNIDTVRDRADLMLAEVLLLNKDFGKSAAKYGEIKAKKSLEQEDLQNYAKASINSGDTTNAVNLYLEYFRKYPKSSCKNALPIGNLLYGLRRYETAVEILRIKADTSNCPKDDNTVRALYFIGSSYFSQKDKADSAIAPLQQAVKYDSNALYVRNLLAQAYLETKKDKQAKDELLRVTELGKGNPKAKSDVSGAYQQLCNSALKAKNFSELQKHAQGWYNNFPAGDTDPAKGNASLYLAISYYQTEPATACKYYKEVLQYQPNNKDAKIQIEQLACDSMGKAPAKKGKK
jgi:predicted Zn-dependent protease